MVFAEWMAAADHPETKAFHVNLVREGYELESTTEFQGCLSAGLEDRFQRWTWEEIAQRYLGIPELRSMSQYLRNKTAGLKPAIG